MGRIGKKKSKNNCDPTVRVTLVFERAGRELGGEKKKCEFPQRMRRRAGGRNVKSLRTGRWFGVCLGNQSSGRQARMIR